VLYPAPNAVSLMQAAPAVVLKAEMAAHSDCSLVPVAMVVLVRVDGESGNISDSEYLKLLAVETFWTKFVTVVQFDPQLDSTEEEILLTKWLLMNLQD
jgi:hypothetical protein